MFVLGAYLYEYKYGVDTTITPASLVQALLISESAWHATVDIATDVIKDLQNEEKLSKQKTQQRH